MEEINFKNINEYKDKDFAIYNQLMINKALEEGHIDFLPSKKINNKSIGEWIELKYKQLHNEEFERYFHNGWLDDYDHLIGNTPKITKQNSLLYAREWILLAKEVGLPLDNRKKCNIDNYSIGELIKLSHCRSKTNKKIETDIINRSLKISNKTRIKIKITKVKRKDMKYDEK